MHFSIRIEALGESHPDTIDSRLALAKLYGDLEQVAAARSEAELALALAVEHLGEESALADKAREALAQSQSKFPKFALPLDWIAGAGQTLILFRPVSSRSSSD